MNWHISYRAEPTARAIADRHYNRQSIGAINFCPPGRAFVLVIPDVAVWVTSWPFAEYVKHAWAGAWVCSAFRNERPDLHRSSDLIREAIAATRWRWPSIPALGMITFVDTSKTRHKRDPGRCYRKGWFRASDAARDGRWAHRAATSRCRHAGGGCPARCARRPVRSGGRMKLDEIRAVLAGLEINHG